MPKDNKLEVVPVDTEAEEAELAALKAAKQADMVVE